MIFDEARAVADAVLFEGYALYPYRPSAIKNRIRWQFGVLAPRAFSDGGGGDPWWQETQCLLQPRGDAARIEGKVRFLHLAGRGAGDDRAGDASWDEGEVREVDFGFALDSSHFLQEQSLPFLVAAENETSRGPSSSLPIAGAVRVNAELVPADQPLIKVRLRVENVTAWALPGAPRPQAMRGSMLGTHVLMVASGGQFVSLQDPPTGAAAAAKDCRNVRTYPVLAGRPGRHDLLLSSPVILPDHPAVAPESAGDLFDATEIDEILTLRTLTLTDDEKREARAADPRVAALIDRVESLSPERMSRLHGVIRELRPIEATAPAPAAMSLVIQGVEVRPGSRVRLHPGRRADSQDMFLDGLEATVETIVRDTDDRDCLAVTIDNDPGAELLRWHSRFYYFTADEVEPLAPRSRVEAAT
ncbi:MAG TPA: hypothetical protein VGL59_08230 [Polyangia bacterium]